MLGASDPPRSRPRGSTASSAWRICEQDGLAGRLRRLHAGATAVAAAPADALTRGAVRLRLVVNAGSCERRAVPSELSAGGRRPPSSICSCTSSAAARTAITSCRPCFSCSICCDRIGLAVRDDGLIERRAGLAEVARELDLAVRAARALQRHTALRARRRYPRAQAHPERRRSRRRQLGCGHGAAGAQSPCGVRGLVPAELAQLGLSLGADVPVFVHGHIAWGEGRGERLTPISTAAALVSGHPPRGRREHRRGLPGP